MRMGNLDELTGDRGSKLSQKPIEAVVRTSKGKQGR